MRIGEFKNTKPLKD